MFDFPVRIPHLIVLLGAAAWVLFLFYRKPEYLALKPVLSICVSFVEAFMLGLAWAGFLWLSRRDPLEGLLWSGLLTASLWFGLLIYCRYRYWQSIQTQA